METTTINDWTFIKNVWYHIVNVHTGKETKFYVDGVLTKTRINETGIISKL